ncbi:MAG: DNA polymerase III subunit alpha [Gammaproteobacteria bacterium]|nr:DNA polymerase III subunit alpha [Gammaproteobacteria bacterium]
MSTQFVHLRLHTEFSIVDSVIRVPALVERVRLLGMPAVAVTEQSNLFSAVKLYRAAEAAGIKPLLGADLWVRSEHSPQGRAQIVLLIQDLAGYRNLSHLLSRAYLEGQRDGIPQLEPDWFEGRTDGLIALSGGRGGEPGHALLTGTPDLARQHAQRWARLFPDRYYLELQRTGRPGEEEYINLAVELATQLSLPVVATNDVRFLLASDFDAHEARICIHDGRTLGDPRRSRPYSSAQHLKSADEMAALFADLPEALENSVHIARRCNLELRFGEYHLPEFPVPEGEHLDPWFRSQTRTGLARRLETLLAPATGADPGRRQVYELRLEAELDVICKMGFASYFLIVADFIGWARENGIPVGPGRGSGAGSLAAFALGITDLDPLAYDLLFERFLNPERVSMPDFDVDFCMDRRDEVIEYVARRYGRDRVAQIITHGTMAAKAVVRDVGRVLGLPYGVVDQIAKLVPFALDMTLDKALAEEPALKERYEQEDEVRNLIDLARQLEGLTRNAGRHAGGVVIAPRPMTEFVPLYCEQGSTTTVSQFDMGDIEAIGLVKFDFLGLRTLTIIDWAIRDINRTRAAAGAAPIDIAGIPLDDERTFQLVRRAETTAVFQLESRGMRELIKRLQPDRFEDLIALVALFRPGPLQSGMVEDFIDRKHGRAKVLYPHPDVEPVLQPTYGVILYQEQVMQIAQVLAGYTLGAADLLRRAMGKKKAEEMAKQRQIFVDGAAGRGVNEGLATRIFDLMEKFAGYGFNKSHSAAYALVAYQTAWLKAHHPGAFMAAVMSADMDNTDKVVNLMEECRRMGLAVEPPQVNSCGRVFTVADARTIRYGLGAIKGVGESAVESIIGERNDHGPFADLFDLCRRIDLRRANRRVLEALIKAGALDGLGPSRRAMCESLSEALLAADQQAKNRQTGQDDLFGSLVGNDCSALAPVSAFASGAEWLEQERLAGEKETLGLYLTGHPIARYEAELGGLVSCRLADLKPGTRRVAGLLVGIRTIKSRRGRIAFATLDDRSARVDVRIFSELYESRAEVLGHDRIVVIEGECALDEFSGENALTAAEIWAFEDARSRYAKRIVLRVCAERAANGFIDELAHLIEPQQGTCPVEIEYEQTVARARIRLGQSWRVRPTDVLLDAMRAKFGEGSVRLEY